MFFRFCCAQNEEMVLLDTNVEQTLVIVRGDIISRGLLGEVISSLEKHFSLVAMKTITFDKALVDKLYGGAKNKDFYPKLVAYMTTDFHLAIVLEGENAVQKMLSLKGNASLEEDNTLRKKYGINETISSIHCSHNSRDANREIQLFFKKHEIHKKIPSIEQYLQFQPRGNIG